MYNIKPVDYRVADIVHDDLGHKLAKKNNFYQLVKMSYRSLVKHFTGPGVT